MKYMINDTEKNVIAHIRKSKNLLELSRKTEYPKSTLYDTMHRLESRGVIKHTNKIAFDKIGYPIQMFINVKTLPAHKLTLRKYLGEQKNINNLYVVNSPTNFHFEAIFKDQKEVEEFLEILENQTPLAEMNVFSVLETVHSEKFLTEFEHFE
jgi:Lrp/AsnC family leucine-responsive transcriptional regulator